MIPSGIKDSDFLRAARAIDTRGVPALRASRDYDVYVNAVPYPPKYLISVAARFSTGEEWPASKFITTEARSYLKTRGYEVRRKGTKAPPVAPSNRGDAILLTWRDPEADGYVDVFPLKFFAENSSARGMVHAVRGPRGGEYEAKCLITVKDRMADLNYEAFRSYNLQRGNLLGVTRITFSDTDRTAISKVEWKPEKTNAFTTYPFESPAYETTPSSTYKPPTDSAPKVSRMVRERPGQAKFRRRLRAVYNNRCCITGCNVAEALEGAHIDPYRSDESDNMKNGLLLRRDVHALFDAYLISIDPKTREILVSDGICCFPEYARLRSMPLNRPLDASHEPDSGAIQRHWESFRNQSK